jgi:hypothetical protein
MAKQKNEPQQPQPERVELATMPDAELWRLAFEQQELITALVMQSQQAQANINAIRAEIERRKAKAD